MLSDKIYTLRRKSGLSQEQLAEKIGVSRQAVSKWEGGLSTPELDKLKALSECFHVTLDELTGEQDPGAPSDGTAPQPDKPDSTEPGGGPSICLCLAGAVCLILFGILMIVRPSSVEQLNESSMVTLNGSGILIALFLLLMAVGMALVLKKK